MHKTFETYMVIWLWRGQKSNQTVPKMVPSPPVTNFLKSVLHLTCPHTAVHFTDILMFRVIQLYIYLVV